MTWMLKTGIKNIMAEKYCEWQDLLENDTYEVEQYLFAKVDLETALHDAVRDVALGDSSGVERIKSVYVAAAKRLADKRNRGF